MPFKFGKLAGGFLALAALTAAGAPVKVPVPAENNGFSLFHSLCSFFILSS